MEVAGEEARWRELYARIFNDGCYGVVLTVNVRSAETN